jgi:hypothetical protein
MNPLEAPLHTSERVMRLFNVNIVSEHGLFFCLIISNGGGW